LALQSSDYFWRLLAVAVKIHLTHKGLALYNGRAGTFKFLHWSFCTGAARFFGPNGGLVKREYECK
jgi:hypothetical protein